MKLVILTLVTLAACDLFAIPQQINYQGQLTRTNGSPLDTTVAITFRLYNVVSGGTSLWTETHPSVAVTAGLFQVLLGSVTTLPDSFTANTRWLGVTVGNNTEMTPRRQIASIPYAYRAGTVDGATGGTVSGDVVINSKLNVGTGNTNAGSFANVLGQDNVASGSNSAVGGGRYNKARGSYAVIAGGGSGAEVDSNSATGNSTFIGSGRGNVASGTVATVGGGEDNISSSSRSVVSGGIRNTASNVQTTVGGGEDNTASGSHATVGGGGYNKARGAFSFIGGGGGTDVDSNSANGFSAAIVGGFHNLSADSGAFVGGGANNRSRGKYSVVAGGGGLTAADSNSASGDYAVIGGGKSNTANGDYAVIGGGSNNTALDLAVTVGGGHSNSAIDYAATIAGGYSNTCSGDSGTVGGGSDNNVSGTAATVSGGYSNYAFGYCSTIPGGYNNTASARFAFAAGRNTNADDVGAFIWGDSTDGLFSSAGVNTFNVRSSGGINLWTNPTLSVGVTLTAGDNTWNSVCDSTLKTRIEKVSGREMLDKLADVPVYRWHHKDGNPNLQHIGPMAQDFWNAFKVGGDSLKISTIDPSGVALAAIQELAKQLEEERTAVRRYETRNLKQDEEIAELRAMVQSLIAEKQHSSWTGKE